MHDPAGRIAIDGVYGVPETYVIDQRGVIRYKHVGPLTPEVRRAKLEPLIRELGGRVRFALLLALALSAHAQDHEMEKRVTALATELRCLVCQNQTLADSNAPLAVDLRNQIREQLKSGKSERDVMEYMVARYGDFVLYRPPLKATTIALWAGPFVFPVLGAWIPAPAAAPRPRARAFRRRARARGATLNDAVLARDRRLAAAVLYHLLRSRKAAAISRREANIAIYRDQLRELEADLKGGLIAQGDYERARRELEGRLDDAPPPRRHRAAQHRGAAPRGRWGRGSARARRVPRGRYAGVRSRPSPMRMRSALSSSRAWSSASPRGCARTRTTSRAGSSWDAPTACSAASASRRRRTRRRPRAAATRSLADLADVLAMARGQSLEGEPEKLVLRALEIDPANLKALALAGTAAFARKDYARAAAHWEKMLAHVPPDSEDARAIRGNVQEARCSAGSPEVAR